ncbi:hypothetical protein ACLKA7_009101 [Drosophila subpalustris]
MRIVSNLVFCIITIFQLCLLIQADFENDVLDEHNKYRKKHGCPNLKLDSSLNDDCKSYAQEIAAANALTHSDGPYGENLCYTTSDPVTCVKNCCHWALYAINLEGQFHFGCWQTFRL